MPMVLVTHARDNQNNKNAKDQGQVAGGWGQNWKSQKDPLPCGHSTNCALTITLDLWPFNSSKSNRSMTDALQLDTFAGMNSVKSIFKCLPSPACCRKSLAQIYFLLVGAASAKFVAG